MLVLLAVPVMVCVALAHRLLHLYAPSNVLIARSRIERPRSRTALRLALLAGAAFVAMHLLAEAVTDGAPGWLNLVVLVLAWDAIRFGLAAGSVALRSTLGCGRSLRGRQRELDRSSLALG
jgi:hypothetical protein